MVNHLMFLRDLYIYEDDSGEIEINENVMKRLTELNLEDFIAQAFEDIERLPKGDEETEENLQDLKEYFGDELGIEL